MDRWNTSSQTPIHRPRKSQMRRKRSSLTIEFHFIFSVVSQCHRSRPPFNCNRISRTPPSKKVRIVYKSRKKENRNDGENRKYLKVIAILLLYPIGICSFSFNFKQMASNSSAFVVLGAQHKEVEVNSSFWLLNQTLSLSLSFFESQTTNALVSRNVRWNRRPFILSTHPRSSAWFNLVYRSI